MRALLPALLVAVILGVMIAGGIARNRARVRGATEHHSGRAKLSAYADHAARWLESRQAPGGAWSCNGDPSPEVTARVLLNLASAGRSDSPSFASGLTWLRLEAGSLGEISDVEAALVIGRALGTGSGATRAAGAPAPAPVAEMRFPEGAGEDRWIEDAYLAMLTVGGADPSAPGEEDRLHGELGKRAGEPPWPDRETLHLTTLIRLKASVCLAGRDRCHVLDAAVGDLVSRMTPEGAWTSGDSPAGSCRLSGEEVTAAAMGALAIYQRVLEQRAVLVRPTTNP